MRLWCNLVCLSQLKEHNNPVEWDAANSFVEFVVQSFVVGPLWRVAQFDRYAT
jgi:hypothetical protein